MLNITLEQWLTLAAVPVVCGSVCYVVTAFVTWAFDADFSRRAARYDRELDRLQAQWDTEDNEAAK